MKKLVLSLCLGFLLGCSSPSYRETYHLDLLSQVSNKNTVKIISAWGSGSGVLIKPNLVLTACHVIDDGFENKIDFILTRQGEDTHLVGTAVACNKKEDLGLIKLTTSLEDFAFLSTINLHELDAICVSGWPGQARLATHCGLYHGYHESADLQQGSAHVMFGNSGGPVFHYNQKENRYEVVGIVVAMGRDSNQFYPHIGYFRGLKRIKQFLYNYNQNP